MKRKLLSISIISTCITCFGIANAKTIEEIVVVGERPQNQGTLRQLNGLESRYRSLASQEASRGRKLIECTLKQQMERVGCEASVLRFIALEVAGCAKGNVVREAEIELNANAAVVGGRISVKLFDATQYYNECINTVNADKEAKLKGCEAQFNSYGCELKYGA